MRFQHSLFLILSSLTIFCKNPTSGQCLEHQKSSLLTLFSSTQSLSWSPDGNCCSWEGVTCDKSTGYVTGLDLSMRSIESTSINSTSLASLSSLQILNLSLNFFDSSIPSAIGDLSNLTHLNLSNSRFIGKVPVEISHLKQLVHLDLSFNKFSGQIPSLVNLKQLVHLDLSSNRLSGQIPQLDSLTNIVEIIFSNDNLSGQIPSSYGNGLLNLKMLDLSHNSLNGLIPLTLFKLPSLQSLQLSNNQFNALHDELNNLSSSLSTVDLSNNNLQGSIPTSIFKLTGLKVLTLSSNNFSGHMALGILRNLKNLSNLDLSDNRLSINGGDSNTSSIPQFLTFKMRSCNLTQFPDFLMYQTKLVSLDLSNNNIGGAIPNWLWMIGNPSADFLSLNYLNLSYNILMGFQQPPINLSLSRWNVIDYSNNRFEGSILEQLGNLKSLHGLIMSHNMLTGSIPSSLGKLSQLESLDLSVNNLSGAIPQELTTLTFLSELNLSYNQLEGTIPLGGQFSTFPCDSFLGNPGLRDPPLSSMCNNSKAPSDSQFKHKINWQLIIAELGFVFGNAIVIIPLMFWKSRIWYYKHLDNLFFKAKDQLSKWTLPRTPLD